MLVDNKVTWILQGKQNNICPRCVFSGLIFSVSNHLVCTEFKSITEVIGTIVPSLSSPIFGSSVRQLN